MKVFENTTTFEYPWAQVTAANWIKYPNELSSHVVAVDVLQRQVDSTGTKLTTERLITCQQKIPSWLAMIVGKNISHIREVSVVDLKNQTLTLKSVNLSYSSILKVHETVVYEPLDHKVTQFHQEAQITAYLSLKKLCNKLEDWSINTFEANAAKGKKGFDLVLERFAGLK